MANPSSIPFSSPDSPGDETFALVLLEGSGAMLGYWHEVREHYLPALFRALRTDNQGAPLHLCWQLSADPYNQAAGVSGAQVNFSDLHPRVPDFRFESGTSNPLTPNILRRSIEILNRTTHDRPATRHLIVVAVSPPMDSSGSGASQSALFSNPETWQSIALSLFHERIRLHLILSCGSHMNLIRDFHQRALHLQSCPLAPLWFHVDQGKFSVHLAAKPMPSSSDIYAGDSPVMSPASATSNPVTPITTVASLPTTSPTYDSPSSSHSLSASPPSTRRIRAKTAKESLVPPSPDSAAPGLVNYLKQMHGLTKKRTYGGKTAKRAAPVEPPRASASRPILPRLELPPANLVSDSADPKTKAADRALIEAASSSGSGRYAPIAPAVSPPKPSSPEDSRRVPPRRWPWLQPAPVNTSSTEGGALNSSVTTALRNLQTITPRMPQSSTQLPGEQHQGRPRSQSLDLYASYSRPGTASASSGSHSQPQPQPAYPPGVSSSPSQPTATQAAQPGYQHMVGAHANVPYVDYSSPSHHTSPSTSSFPPQAPQYTHSAYHGRPHHPYLSPTDSQGSSPLPSPSLTTRQPLDENQPFVVTPEYEAMANAQFEEAVRSGAMQAASLTPSVLSPVATSPVHGGGGYFPQVPSHDTMVPPHLQQSTPPDAQSPDYSFGVHPQYSQHESHVTQGAYYPTHQAPNSNQVSNRPQPGHHIGYYQQRQQGHEDPSEQWYGP